MTTSEKCTRENPEENLLRIYVDTVERLSPEGVLNLLSTVLKSGVFDPCCRRAEIKDWLLSSACHARVKTWQEFEYVTARLFESMLLEAFAVQCDVAAENELKESQRKQADNTLQELLLEEQAEKTNQKRSAKRKRGKSERSNCYRRELSTSQFLVLVQRKPERSVKRHSSHHQVHRVLSRARMTFIKANLLLQRRW
jgi:hypothetical protein